MDSQTTVTSQKAVRQLKSIQRHIRSVEKRTGKKIRLAAEWDSPWKVLISTILSPMTMDEVTIQVCEVLFKKYPGLKALSKADINDVQEIIGRVNYYKTKSKRIIEVAKILAGKKLPTTTEELLKLPGVGRKVANVFLAEAYGKDVIGVDTHVARISKKLGWTDQVNPHKVEQDLVELFSKKYRKSINDTLVRFGKTYTKKWEEDEVLERIIDVSA